MGHNFKPIVGRGSSSGKGSGSTSHVAQEDPNSLQSNSVARAVYLISRGPCVGLYAADKSIFFDKTALMASDGTYNFQGIAWYQRTGEADQDYVEGFSSVATAYSVNLEVKKATPIIRTLNGPIDAARVTIALPYLAYQNKTTGDLLKTSVAFTLSKRVTGTSTWTDVVSITYNDKCVSTFQESFRIELGGVTDWDIKYTRITEDSTESNLQNKTNWASTTVITDGKFIYPNSGYIAMAVDAKQFGTSVPQMCFDWKGLIVKIPSNYNPTTRAYTGIWDGTFTTGWTDNPAWVLYALLTDKDFGLGHRIAEAQVNKYALYEIAQYCDELVSNGFGGLEPRYTFNYQIMGQADAYKVLQSVASSFRGLTYDGAGQVYFFCDMPQDSVKIFTNSDVIDGNFTYEGVALSARHSVCLVTWFDPGDYCNQAIEMVDDADMLDELGWRELTIIAYGCTSRGQAHRMGKWALDTERYATETVNFEIAWRNCGVAPGDVVEIYDAVYSGERLGGRVVSSTTTSVVIDSAITITSGVVYTLTLVMPDLTLVTRTLTNVAGSATTLTFASALSTQPLAGASWAVKSDVVAARQFRIMSIKEMLSGQFAVSAVQYDSTKYARVEQDINLDPVSYTRYSTDKPLVPVNIFIQEYLYRYNLETRSAVTITWDPPADISLLRGYEVEISSPDGAWLSLGVVKGTSVDCKTVEAGIHTIRVRSIGFAGVTSDWKTKVFSLFGIAAPPDDVTGFAVHVLGDMANLRWTANDDLDLSYYRIKHSPVSVGATWSASTDLLPQVGGIAAQVPAMAGTYLIKAVDLSGSESAAAALVIVAGTLASGWNAVETATDTPDWDGTHAGTAIDGATIVLNANNTVTGGSVGTPGTLPDNWASGASGGMSIAVAALGNESGIDYADIRIHGTPTEDGNCWLSFLAAPAAALLGETWTFSTYVTVAAGAATNAYPALLVHELDSGAGWLKTWYGDELDLTEPALISTQQALTETLTESGTAYVSPWLAVGVTTGNAVDITLRIGLPQMEKASAASTFAVNATGTYTFKDTVDLGEVYTSRLSGSITGYGSNLSDIWAAGGLWSVSEAWVPEGPDTWDAKFQMRKTDDDPSGTPTWSDWSDLIVGDYAARAYQFRLALSSFSVLVTPVISDAVVTVDMPDRMESAEGVSAPDTGITVAFTNGFHATPAITPIGQNLATGDYWAYTTPPSATGFAGIWKNAAGAGVARTMDWIAKGYGKVL